MPVAYSPDLIDLPGRPIEMSDNHQLHIRVQRKSPLQSLRAHVPGIRLGIDKDCFAVFVCHRIDRRVEGHIGAEHLPALQRPVVRPRLTVEPFARELCGHVEGGRAAAQSDGVLDADLLRHQLLNHVYVLTDGTHPVGSDGFVNPPLFVAVHGRAAQPHLFIKPLNSPKSRVSQKIHERTPTSNDLYKALS